MSSHWRVTDDFKTYSSFHKRFGDPASLRIAFQKRPVSSLHLPNSPPISAALPEVMGWTFSKPIGMCEPEILNRIEERREKMCLGMAELSELSKILEPAG